MGASSGASASLVRSSACRASSAAISSFIAGAKNPALTADVPDLAVDRLQLGLEPGARTLSVSCRSRLHFALVFGDELRHQVGVHQVLAETVSMRR